MIYKEGISRRPDFLEVGGRPKNRHGGRIPGRTLLDRHQAFSKAVIFVRRKFRRNRRVLLRNPKIREIRPTLVVLVGIDKKGRRSRDKQCLHQLVRTRGNGDDRLGDAGNGRGHPGNKRSPHPNARR